MAKLIKTDANAQPTAVCGVPEAATDLPITVGASTSTYDTITDLIVTGTISDTATWAASSSTTLSFDCSKTGYVLLGVIGLYLYNENLSVWGFNRRVAPNENSVNLRVYNRSANAISSSVNIYCLYMKDFS